MKKITKYTLIILGLIIIQFPLFYKFWLGQAGGWLIHQDKIEKAAAILVLGGGRGERVLQGAKLYREKYADLIMMSGEFEQVMSGPVYHWAVQGQKLASSRGVPKNKVWPIFDSLSTHDDATLSLAECQKRHIKSLIVVTEPFHTKRAYYVFKKVYKNSGIKVMIYPVQDSWYKRDTWWYSEYGLMATTNEYIKFVYYQLKGFI
ncbi:MAG: YdcF family protein [Elusimicrobia bacterium]|nr:YdcF family protein [Elusimicrobiota bacterium]